MKRGIIASIAALIAATFQSRGGAEHIQVNGFNAQPRPTFHRHEFMDAHISPAAIRRRRSKGRKHKQNRLHLSRKAKLARRPA